MGTFILFPILQWLNLPHWCIYFDQVLPTLSGNISLPNRRIVQFRIGVYRIEDVLRPANLSIDSEFSPHHTHLWEEKQSPKSSVLTYPINLFEHLNREQPLGDVIMRLLRIRRPGAWLHWSDRYMIRILYRYIGRYENREWKWCTDVISTAVYINTDSGERKWAFEDR